jgi:hypothetical protein
MHVPENDAPGIYQAQFVVVVVIVPKAPLDEVRSSSSRGARRSQPIMVI